MFKTSILKDKKAEFRRALLNCGWWLYNFS